MVEIGNNVISFIYFYHLALHIRNIEAGLEYAIVKMANIKCTAIFCLAKIVRQNKNKNEDSICPFLFYPWK